MKRLLLLLLFCLPAQAQTLDDLAQSCRALCKAEIPPVVVPDPIPPVIPIPTTDWVKKQFPLNKEFSGVGKHRRFAQIGEWIYGIGGDFPTAGAATQNYNPTIQAFRLVNGFEQKTVIGYMEKPANGLRPFFYDQIGLRVVDNQIETFAAWMPTTPPYPHSADVWDKLGIIPIKKQVSRFNGAEFSIFPDRQFLGGQQHTRPAVTPEGHWHADDQTIRFYTWDGLAKTYGIASTELRTTVMVQTGRGEFIVFGWPRKDGENANWKAFLWSPTGGILKTLQLPFPMYSDTIPIHIPGYGVHVWPDNDQPTGFFLTDDLEIKAGLEKPESSKKFMPNFTGYDATTKQVWAFGSVHEPNPHVIATYTTTPEPLPPPPTEEPTPVPPSTLPIIELEGSDIANTLDKQPLVDLGYLGPNGENIGFSRITNIFGYSGMAKRGQRVFFYGSGGAGGFGGNCVIFYDLLTHETGYEVLPTHSVHVYKQKRVHTSGPYAGRSDDTDFAALPGTEKHYNRDGSPASPHAYRQLHSINGVLTQIGSANIFYNDSGTAGVVNEVHAGKWVRKPGLSNYGGGDDRFIVSHNGMSYIGTRTGVLKSDNTWLSKDSNYQHIMGPAGIDPDSNLLVRLSDYPYDGYSGTKEKGQLVTYDLATGARTIAQVIGDISGLSAHTDYARKASPMDWIPQWNAFGVLLPDDTFYKLARIDAKTYELKAVFKNTGLVEFGSGQGTTNSYWSRGRYSPELGGFVFFGHPTKKARLLVLE